jgi:hypothetical protein
MRRESNERWKEGQEELAELRRESMTLEEGQQELAELRRESDERFGSDARNKHVRIKHESSIGHWEHAGDGDDPRFAMA